MQVMMKEQQDKMAAANMDPVQKEKMEAAAKKK